MEQRTTAGPVTAVQRVALSVFRRLPVRARFAVVRRTTPTFSVGAVAVLQRGDRLMLLRQRHHAGWTLPGGLLARGELPRQALERELAEELGLVGLDLPQRPTAVAFHPGERHIDAVFRVHLPDGQDLPVEPDGVEVLSVGWRRADDPELAPVALAALRVVPGLPGLTDP